MCSITEILLYHRCFSSELSYPNIGPRLLPYLYPSGYISPPQIFEYNGQGWGEDVKVENRYSSGENARSNVTRCND